jgi:hypothetical protein
MSRRPFLLVFATDVERREWVQYLTSYIAHTFLSEQFMHAEKVSAAEGVSDDVHNLSLPS